MLVDPAHSAISVSRQCELLGLARSSFYYEPQSESAENQELLQLLDEQYTRTPFYGVRRMTAWLHSQGYAINKKRVHRLLQILGVQAMAPGPHTSRRQPQHPVYPYLLRGVSIERVNHVWSTDITYIRLVAGFAYLVAIMDWYSRYVLAWEVSVNLESSFCVSALDWALTRARPAIFNSDQGAQFTSAEFTNRLLECDIRISMDGRGRALDNIFVERLWRSVKYEEVYLKDYGTVMEARGGLGTYFEFYNRERLHQALGYRTPEAVYFEGQLSKS